MQSIIPNNNPLNEQNNLPEYEIEAEKLFQTSGIIREVEDYINDENTEGSVWS
jgi:hypothetical protein